VNLSTDTAPQIADRYLGGASKGVYLIRPDQHVAARWTGYNEGEIITAVKTATGQGA